MENISRKEQPLTKDWREEVGVLARADGAKENDVGVGTNSLRQRQRCLFESGKSCSHALGAFCVTVEVLGRDERIGRNEPIRHGDDAHSSSLRIGAARKRASVFQLAAKIQATQEAEDIAQWDSLRTQAASER